MLKIGLFMMPLHIAGRDYHQTLQEDIEAALYAEELGFEEYWCGEHYTSATEAIVSPMMFLSYLTARTKRIKLATGVSCLPLHHPVVAGSQAAMLDHLSEGRFIFGIGPGGLASDMELLGTLEEDRPAMMRESIEMIQTVWNTEAPYDIKGKYWTTKVAQHYHPDIGLGVMIKPMRPQGPPIAVSMSSPYTSTMKLAAQKGWIPVSANFVAEWNVATHWPVYEAECARLGKVAAGDIWHVARSIHIADTDEEAERAVKAPGGAFDWYFDYLWRIYDRGDLKAPVVAHQGDDPAKLTYTDMRDNFIIHGSPETVTRKLLAFRDKVGPFGTLLMAAHDWSDKRAMKRSMELLAKVVLPAINEKIGANESALAAE